MSLTTNLVSYWKLDESSGNAADSVGSNTLTNSNATYDAAKINNGAVFNGTTSILSKTSSSFAISGANPFSTSFWIRPTAYPTTVSRVIVIQNQASASTEDKSFYHTSAGAFTFHLYAGADKNITTSGGVIATNTWNYVVGTYDGTNMRLYINGSLYGSPLAASSSYAETNPTFVIANTASGAGNIFTGSVDEVGFWNRAITSTEITTLYNSGAGLQYPFTFPATMTGISTITGLSTITL